MAEEKYRVINPLGMWLRTKPLVNETTKIDLLPHGQLVVKLGDTDNADWWRIATTFNGNNREGVSKKTLLAPADEVAALPTANRIREVHLPRTSPVIRNQKGLEAFALNETPHPARDGATADEKVKQLGEIIKWLGVSRNKRYLPTETETFCNIYAYDFSHLAGVYVPRVWWNATAIQKLMAGQQVTANYAVTVEEVTANQLAGWFHHYGQIFGWRKTESLTEIQLAANAGKVGIINARKTVGHGHICAVVPETESQKAEWDGTHARVLKPLTSQAGRQNFEYKANVWWNANFQDLGFWIHD